MSRRILSLIVAVALVAFGASFAVGAVVFDGGGPDGVNGFNITQGYWISADDFILSQPTTITDVHFWVLGYPTPPSGGFSWSVYADSYDANKVMYKPGALVGSGSALNIVATPTGNYPIGMTEYMISFDLNNPLALNASWYWLALQSSSPLFWETTGAGTGQDAVQSIQTSPYDWNKISNVDEDNHNLAFQLTSTPVPIPGAVWLLGSGIVGLIGLKRRMRK